MASSNSYWMLPFFCFFFHLGIQTIHSLPSESILCHDDERNYVLDFMRSFNSSWSPEYDEYECCSWMGIVECDDVTGHIVSLSVNDLDGSIDSNSSLFRLSQLKSLDFFGNNFKHSKIPESITNLTFLEFLRISSSNFSGIIPSFLANLTQLHNLDLSDNEFLSQTFSSLSWISHMPKLSYLDLSKANLIGEIPMFIMNMSLLESLDIGYNKLNGPLDFNAFGNLNNLYDLDLSEVNLSSSLTGASTSSLALPSLQELILDSCELGTFPSFFRNLRNLTRLYVRSNNFSGEIPEWFMSVSSESLLFLSLMDNSLTGFKGKYNHLPWSNLEVFDISHNLFQGPIPIPPATISYYLVSNNKFSGQIPPYFSKLKLRLFDISSNNFRGKIPSYLANMTGKLDVLKMRNNKFIGEIPELWESVCYTMAVDLSYNELEGRIPKSLAGCDRMSFFSIKNNNITGSLPSWIGFLWNLKVIDLSQNLLQGVLPKSLTNCSSLEILSLGVNQINDSFPSWLGHFPRLRVLSIYSNKFNGAIRITKADYKFRQLQILDISANNFVGKLPLELFKYLDYMKVFKPNKEAFIDTTWSSFYNADITADLRNKGNSLYYEKIPNALVVLDFSSNRFSGEIPKTLGDLKGLRVLNLSNNILSKEIPSSLGNLSALESMDLSRNNLSGKIPQELTQLDKLGFLDLSYNQLSGTIPKGRHFDTLINSSIIGNVGLCGEPSPNKCIDETLKSPRQVIRSSAGIQWNIIMMGFGTGIIIGISLGYMFSVQKHDLFAKIARKIFHFQVR